MLGNLIMRQLAGKQLSIFLRKVPPFCKNRRHNILVVTLSDLKALLEKFQVHYHHGLSHSGYCVQDWNGNWHYINRARLEVQGVLKMYPQIFHPSGEIKKGWEN